MWIMVAGAYRSGATSEAERKGHLRHLNAAAYAVLRKGHVPIVGVNLTLPMVESAGEEAYEDIVLPMSRALAKRCDGILRLAGPSVGADAELREVQARGGAVFHHLGEVPDIVDGPRFHPPTEHVIQEHEARLRAAVLGSNVAVLDELLADHLVFTHQHGGIVNKAEDLAAHASGKLKITRLEPSDERVLLLEGAAVVTVRVEVRGSHDGKPVDGAFRFTRVWGPGPKSGWQVVAAQATPIAP
jgi:hypothetical protein